MNEEQKQDELVRMVDLEEVKKDRRSLFKKLSDDQVFLVNSS